MVPVDAGDAAKHPAGITLVLGGGGPVGRAWEWGLAAGCLGAGVDWRDAKRIIGTSAGALVGAQLGLGQDATQSRPVVDSAAVSPSVAFPALQRLALLLARVTRAEQPERVRQEIGQLALSAATMSEEASLTRQSLAAIRGQSFPASLWATSVATRDGRFQVWKASSGVPLERAVASSTALPGVWPPIRIGEERYMDGGMRSTLNADLAAGSRTVIVVSCFDLSISDQVGPAVRVRNASQMAEIELLRRQGAEVEVVTPDADFLALTRQGTMMLNPLLVSDAYDLGLRQAMREAARLRRLVERVT